MVNMEDETNEEVSERNEVGELREDAERIGSKKDFLSFLTQLSSLCSGDKECRERRIVHFIDVVEEFIRYDLIEIPAEQDWKVLARLFMIGAFEN
jgi:hypothetical protein